MEKILLAGASGHVGRHLVRELKRSGYFVRTLSRSAEPVPGADEHVRADLTRPTTLSRVCDGVDAVISCAGASLSLKMSERASYMKVDFEGNRNLLDEAQLVGVKRFVYVSVFNGQKLMHTEYAKAHEYFVLALENSGLPYTVVRPTGFFYFFLEMLRMAQQGRSVVLGTGKARTNPIHEADVARLCVEALQSGKREIPAGGPDAFTRQEIVELAFEVVGKQPKITHLPASVFSGAAKVLHPLNARIAGLLDFGAAVSTVDVVAPERGVHTLRGYFEEHVATSVLR